MQAWLASHPLISYVLIFVFVVYIFNKVFRVQKLPILKEILAYLMLALGSFLLLIFQIDKLPIIQCLFVAVSLMFMVRIRYFVEERQRKKEGKNSEAQS
ncbi:YlaH-like family protein [Paenibacillus sp. 481]|uniref:YlaH-like family protein n=1 Tax=Paenibacillus sp. 481 TaxID=2835869 RepID=UPI001E4DEF9B|nr:YlaH-like family protein [Paenibacillus sp. 481]UHA74146.1 YlaH-like family protein [Paenibacillus sp. 481]